MDNLHTWGAFFVSKEHFLRRGSIGYQCEEDFLLLEGLVTEKKHFYTQ